MKRMLFLRAEIIFLDSSKIQYLTNISIIRFDLLLEKYRVLKAEGIIIKSILCQNHEQELEPQSEPSKIPTTKKKKISYTNRTKPSSINPIPKTPKHRPITSKSYPNSSRIYLYPSHMRKERIARVAQQYIYAGNTRRRDA